jgi:UDPglucose 6-dehydrogenase
MSSYKSINIVGAGFVGSAVGYVHEQNNIAYNVYDLQKKQGGYKYFTSDIKDLIAHSEEENDINYYFICVPTPSDSEGNCDTSIVELVVSQLELYTTKKTVVLIKSTLVPGTCQTLANKYKKVEIVLNPEFLREATHKDDMYNADFVLIGSNNLSRESFEQLSDMFRKLYTHNPDIEIISKTFEECELFKYTLNVHLAVKVWYFNKIYELTEKLGVQYDSLKPLFKLDPRIGDYGTKVPGPDGKRGYGLSCLPKETRGMMKLQETLGLDNSVLKQIILENDIMRNQTL